ncbi:MAG: rod shape-determining protein MreD [Candidatus Nealsonbacteria bacterium]|nr:rod shape-determining protein MreD [Candidatus Nealsonbacteria bacterium]
MKKVLIFCLGFYILALLQASFFPGLGLSGPIFNFILIFVLLSNLLENPRKYNGITSAFWGGFFLDIFSENPIGLNLLILPLLAILIKIILRKYVRI